MKDDRVNLTHVLDCIEAVQSYLRPDPDALFKDRRTRKAVLRELQEMAESTQLISADLKNRHPHVPWASIAGFRNVLVHDYLGSDLRRIQAIVHDDLSPLEAAIRSMLAGLR